MVEKISLKDVQDQYMMYPYPYRDPNDEYNRLMYVQGCNLHKMNHFLFQGKRDFTKNFRVLIAGGGTGDSTIYFAEQLKNTNAEIIYLDFSTASMDIVKERAKIRKLTNIQYVYADLLTIPDLGLGKFDFIECCGVLHHLESPDLGLKILANSLKPNSGMYILVYGKIGRTGVYQVQDLMKIVNSETVSKHQKVANAKTLLQFMPKTSWYMRASDLFSDTQTDIGLYDLFMHSQDRAYTALELHKFIKDAGMNFVEYIDEALRFKLDPASCIGDVMMLDNIKKRPIAERHAIMELMLGTIIKHEVYIANYENSIAKFSDMDNVVKFLLLPEIPAKANEYLDSNPDIGNFSLSVSTLFFKNQDIVFNVNQISKTICKFLASRDQDKTIGEITQYLNQVLQLPIDSMMIRQIENFFTPLIQAGVVVLENKSLPQII